MNDIKTNIIKTIDYKFNNDMLHNDMSNTDKTNNSSLSPKPDLSSLPTGKIKYGLTNDYMFRAVFQENKKALE